MDYQHQNLAAGKWQTLSFLEQMGNIGSEVGRAANEQDKEKRWQAATRAVELFDLTIADPRWKKRLKELARAREVFGSALLGNEYSTNLKDLEQYFYHFAFAARAGR
ncbi:MAG: hypothetical protein Q8P82_02415 [bacterium]|nr:hypothetical protein [bacterium]